MPKIKVPRKNTHMDMTAMCDVKKAMKIKKHKKP